MKYVKLLLGILLPLFLISCQRDFSVEQTTETLSDTESISVTQTLSEDVIEFAGGFAYQSDLTKYGVAALEFYKWRQTGNPDLLSAECVPYSSNEGGFVIEPLQKVYSAKDSDVSWGIDIVDISDDIRILMYADALNVDKKIDGQWVRQVLLDPERAVLPGTKPMDIPEYLKRDILNNVFTISLDEAAFEIEPGEYRFIFYVGVEANGQKEYRMYYIPFEVVE